MKYRSEIDGLRAIAILSVVLFHGAIPGFEGGFVGVDIFFVISGYLITRNIVDEANAGRFCYVEFYAKRIRRLFPALFFVVLISFVFCWNYFSPHEMNEYSKSLTSVATFSSNFYFWRSNGYFDMIADKKLLLHLWSLSLEEQFYLIFPFFLVQILKFKKKSGMYVIVVVTLFSLLLAEILYKYRPSFDFYMLITRAWEFLGGSIIAYHNAKGRNFAIIEKYKGLISLFGFFLIVYSVVYFNKATPHPGFYTILPVLGCMLVIYFCSKRSFVGRILGSKPFVMIGLVSYSTYLWHQPLLAMYRVTNGGGSPIGVTITLVVLSFMLGYVTWKYVERPFRSRSQFNKKYIFVYFAVGTLILLFIGIMGTVTNGFAIQRLNSVQYSILQSAVPSPLRETCHTGGENYITADSSCSFFSGKATWAVFGDSHGVELAYSLGKRLEASKLAVKQFTFSGCEPFSGRTDGYFDSDCQKWSKEVVEYLEQHDEIENVVLTYRLNSYLFGEHEKFYPHLPSKYSDDHRDYIWSQLKETIAILSRKKNVVLVLQSPELPALIDAIVYRTEDFKNGVLGVTRSWWDQRNYYVKTRLDELPPNVIVINPEDVFCDNDYCYAGTDKNAYYFDDDHISIYGADILSMKIMKSFGMN